MFLHYLLQDWLHWNCHSKYLSTYYTNFNKLCKERSILLENLLGGSVLYVKLLHFMIILPSWRSVAFCYSKWSRTSKEFEAKWVLNKFMKEIEVLGNCNVPRRRLFLAVGWQVVGGASDQWMEVGMSGGCWCGRVMWHLSSFQN